MSENKTMRILWASEVDPDPNSGAGGTELLTVEQLRKLGHHVECIWARDLPRRIAHGNLHYAFELPRTYSSEIGKALRRSGFDIVTINLGQSYRIASQLRNNSSRPKIIVRSHGLDDHLDHVLAPWQAVISPESKSSARRFFGGILASLLRRHMKLAANYCDGYIVSNSLDAKWLNERHKLPSAHISVIPQAPAEVFQSTPRMPMTRERLNRLLYVANFHFAKGPHAVAKAASILLGANSSLEMTWISKESDHDSVRKLLGPEIARRVRMLGWMPQSELVEEFDRHGIFLYPSFFDGFGKVFLEAMSRGLCLVCTPVGGMIDLVVDRKNGLFAPVNDPAMMASAVQEFLAHEDIAFSISKSAIHTAESHTWDRVAKEMVLFFERCPKRTNRID